LFILIIFTRTNTPTPGSLKQLCQRHTATAVASPRYSNKLEEWNWRKCCWPGKTLWQIQLPFWDGWDLYQHSLICFYNVQFGLD